jgi:hypothetical protein
MMGILLFIGSRRDVKDDFILDVARGIDLLRLRSAQYHQCQAHTTPSRSTASSLPDRLS